MTRTACHRGYVLVMTLLLLAMAGVALAAVAGESHRRALAAVSAQEELQRHWGAVSCQQALLPQAGKILANAAKPRVETVIELGGERFALVFADEQAKANVNLLAATLEGPRLRETVNGLVGSGVALDLSPTRVSEKDPGGRIKTSQFYATYGQVFGAAQPAALIGKRRGLAYALTCWGDQKLNTTAASPAALTAVAGTVLPADELARFERALKKAPRASWQELFRECNILPDKVELMKSRVREDSACQSLWIVSGEGGRARYRLAIHGGPGKGSVFEW